MPRTDARDKPSKFPLFLHQNGQWAKKIRQKLHYFGKDKDSALARYVHERDDLQAGRTPAPDYGDSLTVADLVNLFMASRQVKVEAGELTASTWSQYLNCGKSLVEHFGRNASAASLRPADFARLREAASKRLGPRTLGSYVVLVRSIFRWGYDAEHLAAPVRFGPDFRKPPKRQTRLARQTRGPKMLTPDECRRLLAAADPTMRGCIYLGLNCAYGASDCARLNRSDVAAEPGWLSIGRVKTGEERRCPLWPETVAALEAVALVRPSPVDPVDADAVFLTRQGHRLVRHADRTATGHVVSRRDSLAEGFDKLCKRLEITTPGRFGVLRHVHRTVADESHDTPACRRIMGHTSGSTDAEYRERIGDERLRAVAERVRGWTAG